MKFFLSRRAVVGALYVCQLNKGVNPRKKKRLSALNCVVLHCHISRSFMEKYVVNPCSTVELLFTTGEVFMTTNP